MTLLFFYYLMFHELTFRGQASSLHSKIQQANNNSPLFIFYKSILQYYGSTIIPSMTLRPASS